MAVVFTFYLKYVYSAQCSVHNIHSHIMCVHRDTGGGGSRCTICAKSLVPTTQVEACFRSVSIHIRTRILVCSLYLCRSTYVPHMHTYLCNVY